MAWAVSAGHRSVEPVPRKKGVFEQFYRDPAVRDMAQRLVNEWAIPNINDFARGAVQGFRFPRCSAQWESAIPNVQIPQGTACQSAGVGVCRNCRQPFCHDHGLLFLSGVLDAQRMLALIETQIPGLCTRCIDAMMSFVQQARVAPPPAPQPHQAPPPPPNYPPPYGGPSPNMPNAGPASGPTGPGPQPDLPPRIRQAYAILGLTPPSTMTEIRKTQRALAIKYHPDKGGSADDMVLVNEAVTNLERYLSGRWQGARA